MGGLSSQHPLPRIQILLIVTCAMHGDTYGCYETWKMRPPAPSLSSGTVFTLSSSRLLRPPAPLRLLTVVHVVEYLTSRELRNRRRGGRIQPVC